MARPDLPLTVFDLAGATFETPDLGASTLVLIDYQNEYLAGPLALRGAFDAVDRAVALLWSVRKAGGTVVHVAHAGAPGGLFDRSQYRGALIASLKPAENERIIEKTRPNAFSGTDLADAIGAPGQTLILAGFMTHNCVSSTARAALDHGCRTVVASDACATRDLPSDGEVLPATHLHRAALAALADSHAWVREVGELIPASWNGARFDHNAAITAGLAGVGAQIRGH